MQNNTPEHFAPFQLRSKDGVSQYYYDVSGTQNLALQLNKGFTDEKIQCFAAALNEALEQCGEFLLNEDNLLLDESCILYDSDKNTYIYIYYPGYEQDIVCQLKNMAELFLKAVDYTSNVSVQKVYEFYHLISDETSPLRNLKRFAQNSPAIKPKRNLEYQCAMDQINPPEDIAVKNHPEEHDTSIAPDESTAEDNKGSHPVKVWLILAAILICEAGGSFAAFRLFPNYGFDRWLLAGGGIMLATLAVGIIIFIKTRKSKDDNDFWSPSDYINYDMEPEGSTTLLNTPSRNSPEDYGIRLRSIQPQRCSDLNIKSFPAIIGKEVRDPACCIQDPTISRKHARLERNGRQYRLTDLRSSNGTFINGEMIKPMEAVELSSGDDIIFSDLEFVFEISEGKV